ncbi:MAG TPA: GNAT family N-acetyltransferase [Actinomycetota bacterium]|nr:GNAT family N-acetyltransferase [Actinomycetota bacterium]
MEIRRAAPAEYREAGRVTALAYHEFARPGAADWDAYLAELADVAGRADRTDVFVAVDGDDSIQGCVTLEIDQTVGDDDVELPPDVSCIRMLGVDPSARGRGIGRALVETCISRSREAGKRVVTLRTTERMKAAQALYAAMAFDRDEGNDRVFDNGFRLLAYRMELG